jgi:alkylhydroperoxidase family enzyme
VAATPDGVRLPPLEPKEWPAEMSDVLGALRPANPRHPFPPRRDDRPKGLNVLGLLARYPTLTRAFNTFNGHILFNTSLTPRQRELLVLRVAAIRDASYEWAQHVVIAGDVGLSEQEIADIADVDRGVDRGTDAARWSGLERAMLRAVDELVRDAFVTDETWAALAESLDGEQLMDLVFTVGCYDLLAMAFRSFGLPLDDDLK